MRKPRHQKPRPLPLTAEALRQIERRGISRAGLRDLYHALMTIPLSALLAAMAGSFVVINLIFALIYWRSGGLGGLGHGDFGDAFFFSVQTLSTTGYGAVFPVSRLANIISSFEIMLGVLSTALATGVLFARLSRPQSRVLFSNVVVVRPFQGVPTLMFRIVNERRSEITEARIAVTITGDEVDEDGTVLRRMYALKLERDHSPVFALSWLIMHKIDESSPLHGKVTDEIAASGNVMVCAFTGIDDTVGASLRARHIYGAENVRFGHRFVDVIERKETGEMTIDLRHFHDTIAIDVLP